MNEVTQRVQCVHQIHIYFFNCPAKFCWKEVPQTIADLLRIARLEQPSLAWLDTETDIDDAEELRNTQEDMLTRALFSLQKGESVDHVAFAKLVLAELKDEFVIEREDKECLIVQWFDWTKRRWVRAGGSRHLEDKASEVLRRVVVETDEFQEKKVPR